jgi:hypothetical protein
MYTVGKRADTAYVADGIAETLELSLGGKVLWRNPDDAFTFGTSRGGKRMGNIYKVTVELFREDPENNEEKE